MYGKESVDSISRDGTDTPDWRIRRYTDGKVWYPSKTLITPDNHILVCSLQKLQWFTTDGKLVYFVQGSDEEVANDIGDPDDIALGRRGHI